MGLGWEGQRMLQMHGNRLRLFYPEGGPMPFECEIP